MGWSGSSSLHILGTDTVGRDILARLVNGARVSLLVATAGSVVSLAVGAAIGIVAAYYGGTVDQVLSSLVDIAQSLPTILLALALAAVLGPGLANVLLVVVLVFWASFARQIRGDVMSVKEREYVLAAKATGATAARVIIRHIVPNVTDGAVVMLTLVTGHVVLFEGTLSFLGVGVVPPTPSWGSMIEEGRRVLERAWWVSTSPALAMLIVLLAINFLGDWLRDRLDPRTSSVPNRIG